MLINQAMNNARASEGELKMTALYIAMVVRNALEDFHCKHLSDEQMKELNPLIRDAVYSALHAYAHFEASAQARRFVQHHTEAIPSYWEMPRLYKALERSDIGSVCD